QHDVEPVRHESHAKSWEAREQRSREGHEGHGEKKDELQPRVVAITPRQQIELRALADPEDAKRHEAHGVNKDIRPKPEQRVQEIALGSGGTHRWYGQTQHEQGHADRENAVRNSGEAVDVGARALVKAASAAREQVHGSASPRTTPRMMSMSRSVVRQFAMAGRKATFPA